jgi:hypothetical protein
MDFVNAQVSLLMNNVGDLWFAALIGAFFVMVCESAKPKDADSNRGGPRGLALWIMIMSLLTPFLLFIHAVVAGAGSVFGALIVIGAAVILSAIIGWLIAAAAPDIGRTLNRAAPFLAVLVFALTVYVTWQSAFTLLNSRVLSRLR